MYSILTVLFARLLRKQRRLLKQATSRSVRSCWHGQRYFIFLSSRYPALCTVRAFLCPVFASAAILLHCQELKQQKGAMSSRDGNVPLVAQAPSSLPYALCPPGGPMPSAAPVTVAGITLVPGIPGIPSMNSQQQKLRVCDACARYVFLTFVAVVVLRVLCGWWFSCRTPFCLLPARIACFRSTTATAALRIISMVYSRYHGQCCRVDRLSKRTLYAFD
jgi:hypothetical protein